MRSTAFEEKERDARRRCGLLLLDLDRLAHGLLDLG